jgi:hypothetical protein
MDNVVRVKYLLSITLTKLRGSLGNPAQKIKTNKKTTYYNIRYISDFFLNQSKIYKLSQVFYIFAECYLGMLLIALGYCEYFTPKSLSVTL